jgi:exodeoxyribonuclease VII large subunit
MTTCMAAAYAGRLYAGLFMTNESGGDYPRHDGLPLLRVTQLVGLATELLESAIPDVWVEGEVLEAKRASSGHIYFTLVDASDGPRRGRPDAQLRGVVFLSDQPRLETAIETGVRIRARGRASVFGAQSSLQLIVTHAVAAGLGERAEKLAQLKAKLQKEGLFDPARKRALPRLPRLIGLVTSKQGAAFHDVTTVARRRFPVRIVLAHCTVQGPDAPRSIVAGIEALAKLPGIDVLIVARGGGASEDLSAFDDERVVRVVAGFPVPVVSGVGHEVDVTLVDLAADVRAATPSNAAELVVPDREVLRRELALSLRRLQGRFDSRVQSARLALERLGARLANRRVAMRARREQLRGTERVIERAQRRRLDAARRSLALWSDRLAKSDPRRALARARGELARLSPLSVAAMRAALGDARIEHVEASEALVRAARQRLADERHALDVLAGRLTALSPLSVLSRGYAIALDANGRAITRATDVRPGEAIAVRVEQGTIAARVEQGGGDT